MTRLLWTQKQDIGPAPRAHHKMVYDSKRSRTILFGGDLGDRLANDTWEWDGENWTQLADIGPSKRCRHAMAYDGERSCLVLFGGYIDRGDGHDTWEWRGEDWTQIADTGPPARNGHEMVYDSKRKRVVMFGGWAWSRETHPYNDTWEWDGSDWTQQEETGPIGRADHGMAYDNVRERVALFGGVSFLTGNLTPYPTDTWEWDGNVWTRITEIGPGAHYRHGMVYNGKQVLIFGGKGERIGVHLGSTWSWDGKHWTQRQDIGPEPRSAHAMAYDSKRNRVVLFGGANQTHGFGDTWELFERAVVPGDDT